ncbi:VCBS repeat-containing protein [Aneurinibacillus sp. BA2021]|nr:VCBS repeat-containing protein [Aneurinibacillus sp. BA2021]
MLTNSIRIKIIGLLASVLLLSGCSLLPSPVSTITAPQSAAAQSVGTTSTADFIQTFLPPGSKLLAPDRPEGVPAIQKADLDGNHIEDIIVTYRTNETPYIMLLQKQNEGWKTVWTYKGQGYDIDTVRLVDLTGDGRKELLVGWRMGLSAGNGLDVFTWDTQTMRKLGSTGYHKLEPVQHHNRTLLAIWQKDTGDAYMVDVLQWKGETLRSAPEAYPAYFPKVVAYYEQKVKEAPLSSFYWYYLADAQQKAQQPEQALRSAEKGLSLSQKDSYPPSAQFKEIIVKALKDLGENTSNKQNGL